MRQPQLSAKKNSLADDLPAPAETKMKIQTARKTPRLAHKSAPHQSPADSSKYRQNYPYSGCHNRATPEKSGAKNSTKKSQPPPKKSATN